jgi:YidC/Oxa1 family membrane protein insertase
MQKIQPKAAEIQKKYAKDKEKQSQELMNLYKENNVNPMGGCLPLLIQLPIIFILYQVIYNPLTYMYTLSAASLNKLATLVGFASAKGVQQITIAQKITPDILKMPEFSHLPQIDFNFLGMNLADKPLFDKPSILWLIPILAAATSYLLTALTQAQMPQNNQSETAASINSMNKIMPLLSAFFTFSFPAGIGLYWIMSNVVRIIQQYFINFYFKKKDQNDPLVIDNKSTQKKKK